MKEYSNPPAMQIDPLKTYSANIKTDKANAVDFEQAIFVHFYSNTHKTNQ